MAVHIPVSASGLSESDDGNSTNLSLPMDADLRAYLIVSAVTGSPTLDVTVEELVDGTNWVTIGTFTQATGTGAESISIPGPRTGGPVRVKYLIGGTSVTVDFEVRIAA